MDKTTKLQPFNSLSLSSKRLRLSIKSYYKLREIDKSYLSNENRVFQGGTYFMEINYQLMHLQHDFILDLRFERNLDILLIYIENE